MRIVKLVMAVAIALSPAAPAFAQGAPGGRIDTQSEMVSILKEIAVWNQPVVTLIADSQTVGLFIVDGVIKAGEEDVSGLGGRAWADAFLGEADSKIAALKARVAALEPLPADLSRRYSAISPATARQAKGFAKLPGAARDSVADTERFLADLRPLIVKAAGGDARSKTLIYARALAGTRLSMRGENAMLDITIAMADSPDNPQVHLARSNQGSNDALAIAFEVMEGMIDPSLPEPDAKTAGKAMQAKIAQSRESASRIWPAAQRIVESTSKGLPPGPLLTLMKRAAATYEESAAVELRLLAILDTVANSLLADGGPDYRTWNLDALDPLIDRRLALQSLRAEIVRQQK